jgi:hypothetical protein
LRRGRRTWRDCRIRRRRRAPAARSGRPREGGPAQGSRDAAVERAFCHTSERTIGDQQDGPVDGRFVTGGRHVGSLASSRVNLCVANPYARLRLEPATARSSSLP